MRHTAEKDGHVRLIKSKVSKRTEEEHQKGYVRILKYGRSAYADKVWHNRDYEQICAQYKKALAKRGVQNDNDSNSI